MLLAKRLSTRDGVRVLAQVEAIISSFSCLPWQMRYRPVEACC